MVWTCDEIATIFILRRVKFDRRTPLVMNESSKRSRHKNAPVRIWAPEYDGFDVLRQLVNIIHLKQTPSAYLAALTFFSCHNPDSNMSISKLRVTLYRFNRMLWDGHITFLIAHWLRSPTWYWNEEISRIIAFSYIRMLKYIDAQTSRTRVLSSTLVSCVNRYQLLGPTLIPTLYNDQTESDGKHRGLWTDKTYDRMWR